jgi:uncharacterized membrane protein
LRRLVIGGAIGLVVGLAAATVTTWQVAVLSGWDAAAALFLLSVFPIILRADGLRTEHVSMREDETREAARLILLTASGAALVAVGVALGMARHQHGTERTVLISIATLTVVLSWTLMNTLFTLRYAHIYYSATPGGVDFGSATAGAQPDYRDFAYLAFTIGMTYQVSDTALGNREIRRTVLGHAILSYLYGVVIVATGVNVIAGLVG